MSDGRGTEEHFQYNTEIYHHIVDHWWTWLAYLVQIVNYQYIFLVYSSFSYFVVTRMIVFLELKQV